ncbi:GRAM domain-containing protein 1B-like [Mizuhopecten yessoensis]|uniref:GRAM domain-containing protein 1B n=1 Tax=Mizuhopecten yessoensis TaxID=6573 RepID=A0A210QIW0_MIZYE|nr:GRAM domain-containing protein 1B-like [Mizuhopecten yessoensis]XP_021357051.1 GRAM domain-containing protein 1B-like [Mizuhopecten yessoensis]OWF48693.1 GRAM domain-containing protein 1B [Mizuhopecten yessoensis]
MATISPLWPSNDAALTSNRKDDVVLLTIGGAQESCPISSQQMVMNRKDSTRESFPTISRSRAEKFHKLFKFVSDNEDPIDYFSCAFLGDILLQGNLYVSQNWFCFYSRIRGRGRLLELPMEKVISITREKTALIIPNAIGLQTAQEKYVFGSFISRDNTYKFLYSLWKRTQHQNDMLVHIRNDSNTSNEISFTLSLDQTVPDDPDRKYELKTSKSFTTPNTDIHNNNVITVADSYSKSGHHKLNSCESDSSVCPECGVIDNSDGNGNKDIPTETDHTVQCSAFVHSEVREMREDVVEGWKFSIPYFIQCFDCRKMYAAFFQLAVKFQKVPRTNLLLAICSVMVLFLLLSAMGLTYKILLLQAKLEAKDIWPPVSHTSWR